MGRPRHRSQLKETLTGADDQETLATLRRNTLAGRPLASDTFLNKLEHTLGRRLHPSQSGAPRNRSPSHGKDVNRRPYFLGNKRGTSFSCNSHHL